MPYTAVATLVCDPPRDRSLPRPRGLEKFEQQSELPVSVIRDHPTRSQFSEICSLGDCFGEGEDLWRRF